MHHLRKDYWAEYTKQYGILKLPFAKEALLRLGISRKDIPDTLLMTGSGDSFTAHIESIFSNNQEFRAFLEKHNVTKTHWIGVWTWLEKRERDVVESAYILDDEHLEHLPSIGRCIL